MPDRWKVVKCMYLNGVINKTIFEVANSMELSSILLQLNGPPLLLSALPQRAFAAAAECVSHALHRLHCFFWRQCMLRRDEHDLYFLKARRVHRYEVYSSRRPPPPDVQQQLLRSTLLLRSSVY